MGCGCNKKFSGNTPSRTVQSAAVVQQSSPKNVVSSAPSKSIRIAPAVLRTKV